MTDAGKAVSRVRADIFEGLVKTVHPVFVEEDDCNGYTVGIMDILCPILSSRAIIDKKGVDIATISNDLGDPNDPELTAISPYLRRINPEAKKRWPKDKVFRVGTGLDAGENADRQNPIVIRTLSFPDPAVLSILNPNYQEEKDDPVHGTFASVHSPANMVMVGAAIGKENQRMAEFMMKGRNT